MSGGSTADRERISSALVEQVGRHGFRATSLVVLLESAAVEEEAFHAHFADLEDCFVQVWDDLTAEHGVLMARAYQANPDWCPRMRAMARLTLDYLRADRERARFLVLEVLEAGELAQAHRDLAIAAQAALIDEGRQLLAEPDSVSPAAAEFAAGAINEMLVRKTRSGELFTTGTQVMRELTYLAFRPILGEQEAREESRLPPPTERAAADA